MLDMLAFLRVFLNAILIGMGGVLAGFLVAWLSTRTLSKWVGISWSRFLSSLLVLLIAVWTIKLILDSSGAAGLTVIIVTAMTGAFGLGSSFVASDLVAGLGLFSSKPYDVGQMVSLAGHEGKVINISPVLTTLESPLGDRIYVRNSSITSNVIINYSALAGHMIAVKVPLPVSQDLNVAVDAINKSIQGFCPELADSQFTPTVLVETGGFGYITLEVRAYTTERTDYSPEKTRLFRLAVDSLKQAGLNL
jgi:small-conductance mechanosensitive channel